MKTIKKTVHDAVIEFKGECFGSGFISHSETRGWTPIASKHLPMSDCFEVCSLIAFNAYVDLLASNFGKATQSYLDYQVHFGLYYLFSKEEGEKKNKVYVAAHNLNKSPEFTQEFRLISGRGETWHKCKVVFKGKRYTVVENENGKEFSRRTAKLVIRDVKPTKTDKEKAIDGILCTMGCKGADSDSIYYKMAYRIYDAGYTKPLTVEDNQ